MKPGLYLSTRYAAIFIALTFCMLLSACGQKLRPTTLAQSSPSPTQTVTPSPNTSTARPSVTPSATVSPTPTPTFTPRLSTQSPTLTPFSATPTVTITVNIIDSSHLKTQCLEILPNLPQDGGLSGTLALSPFPKDYKNPAILLDLETNTQKLLSPGENETQVHFTVSPDGKWLAFAQNIWQLGQITDRRLVIADVHGQKFTSIPLSEAESKTGWLGYWLDNQRLITWIDFSPFPTRVINPFTGEEQVLEAEKYSSYYIFAGTESTWDVPVVHDPTLRRVIYPGYTASKSGTQGNYDVALMLLDRTTGKNITGLVIYGYGFPVDRPKWSPDGSQFVFVAMPGEKYSTQSEKDELFIANRDGQITQLTHLANIYKGVTIGDYSWSPDGRKLAFWMALTSPTEQELKFGDGYILAVLDLKTQQVTNYCIPANDYSRPASAPVWSLNSGQIVVTNHDGETRRVVLVDITRNYAAVVINETLVPVGWMVSP